MNGVHDMGGMQGYGPVQPELDEPVFHANWERQALALTVAMGATGQWNIDQARSARESLPPQRYLQNSYYQIWLDALENMMVARGLASHEEFISGQMTQPGAPAVKPLPRTKVDAALAQGTSAQRQLATLDTAFENILVEREARLLYTVSQMLEKRFAQALKQHLKPAADPVARASESPGPLPWLTALNQDVRSALLAELDTRLQPTLGLLEAFSPESTPSL